MSQRNTTKRPILYTAADTASHIARPARGQTRFLGAVAAAAVAVVGMAGCSEANTSGAGSAAMAESVKVVQADSTLLAAQTSDAVSAVVDPAAATHAPVGGDYVSAWGPAVGSTIPMLAAADQQGQAQTLDSLSGEKGLLLVFSRSADW